jgi:hypothetical protein
MTPNPPAEPLKTLIDRYLADDLTPDEFSQLERMLLADAAARDFFVGYCRLETQLHKTFRARRAGAMALQRVVGRGQVSPRRAARRWPRVAAAAAVVLIVGGLVAWALREPSKGPAELAWLTNAQNCDWASGLPGSLLAGQRIAIRQGLAEFRMAGGATVVLEGPADVELLSRDAVRLNRGKLAARVGEKGKGFQVVLPQGRVVDLGTEFGVSVAEDGSSDVTVFEGEVEAYPAANAGKVSLGVAQSARISGGTVTLQSPATTTQPVAFARQIRIPPSVVARSHELHFRAPVPGSLADGSGIGVGLTHRLPGTGAALPASDPNLRILTDDGQLALTTTRSDLNRQVRLGEGEYLGLRLRDLGFTGVEDFEVSVVVPNIPSLAAVGQFGVYAGARADRVIRGGLISQNEPDKYGQFFVNNEQGRDHNGVFVGLTDAGNDVRLTLRRQGGRFSLTVENLTRGASSTLALNRGDILVGDTDVYVGFFGANPGSEERRTLTIDEFRATVWTLQPSPSGTR